MSLTKFIACRICSFNTMPLMSLLYTVKSLKLILNLCYCSLWLSMLYINIIHSINMSVFYANQVRRINLMSFPYGLLCHYILAFVKFWIGIIKFNI